MDAEQRSEWDVVVGPSRAWWDMDVRALWHGPDLLWSLVRGHLAEYFSQTHERIRAEGEVPGIDEVRLLAVRAVIKAPEGIFSTSDAVKVELGLANTGIIGEDLDIQSIVHTDNDVFAFIPDMTGSIGTAIWPLGRNLVTCTIPPDLPSDGGYRFPVLFQRKGNRHFQVQDAISIDLQEGPRRGGLVPEMAGSVAARIGMGALNRSPMAHLYRA